MSVRPLRNAAAGLAAVMLSVPALASAQDADPLTIPLTLTAVFKEAALLPQLIMVGLAAATVAAVVICAMKLLSGPRLSGGSAFLSGLRIGGPLAGLLGASYTAFAAAVGVANSPVTPSLQVVAPGLAEAILMFGMGMLAGSIAVIAHWAVEARIDRTVLRD